MKGRPLPANAEPKASIARQEFGAFVRAGKPEDRMARNEQFFDYGGTDKSGRSGDKNSHKISSRWRTVAPEFVHIGIDGLTSVV